MRMLAMCVVCAETATAIAQMTMLIEIKNQSHSAVANTQSITIGALNGGSMTTPMTPTQRIFVFFIYF